jgi:putative pyrimidine permease RutG
LLPRWAVKAGGDVAPDERLPWPQTIAMGLQHVVVAATRTAGSGPNPNVPVALGGILTAAALYMVIGVLVQRAGTADVVVEP